MPSPTALALGSIVVIVIYFIPSVIAVLRNHPKMYKIAMLNVFLGWTVVVWVIAFLWAQKNENDKVETQK